MLILSAFMLGGGLLKAKDQNGLTVILKDTKKAAGRGVPDLEGWDKVKYVLALDMKVKNISSRDFPQGAVAFTVIVKEWGTEKLLRYTGTDEVPPLPVGQSVERVIGKIPGSGYGEAGNDFEYQNSIEGYRVVLSHGGKETIEVEKPSSFKKLNGQAQDAKVRKKVK